MKICLICTELFAWGKFGGFGRATRIIGREFAMRGIETYAVVPKQKGQKEYELLDGIKVFGFSKHNPSSAKNLLLKCNADIYHSEEPSFITYLAMQALPERVHLITSRDPRNFMDWYRELIYASANTLQVISNFIFEKNFLVSASIRKAARIYCTAKFLEPKVMKKYHLKKKVEFLPTPIAVPQKEIVKSDVPLVCFIARMDRRKRPEIFFELVKDFPEVKFIAAGKSRDIDYEKLLKDKYSNLKNLKITGFINQFENRIIPDIMEKSWILVCPSVDVSLNILVLGWIRSVVIMSDMISISYSGLGVREGIVIYLLRFYNVPADEALIISLLSFAKNLFLPFVGGAIELKDFLYIKNYKPL